MLGTTGFLHVPWPMVILRGFPIPVAHRVEYADIEHDNHWFEEREKADRSRGPNQKTSQ